MMLYFRNNQQIVKFILETQKTQGTEEVTRLRRDSTLLLYSPQTYGNQDSVLLAKEHITRTEQRP